MSDELRITLEKVLSLIDDIIEYTKGIKEEVRKVIEAYLTIANTGWKTIKAPKPVRQDDAAVKWLFKKLRQIREKHPEIKYKFLYDEKGFITALKFKAGDEEQEEDIKAVTNWAFQKASSRPMYGDE